MHVFYLVLTKINGLENLKNIKNERILFSPLNWGWGHVSRSIPLLKQLQSQNNEITIACDSAQQKVYQEYLDQIEFFDWPGYPFHFNGKGNFALDILLSFWKLRSFAKKELNFVKTSQKERKYTIIISDQRYYFRTFGVKSIFVTHQMSLPVPWYLAFMQTINRKRINQFDEVWVMDDTKNSFAGKLSVSRKQMDCPVVYIGPFSRFKSLIQVESKKWTTVLVSGPEPYANQFYQEQRDRLKADSVAFCIIYKGNCESSAGVEKMNWKQIDQRLLETKKLIARSGYSTVMDVHYLECEVEWHPTPGQWEQEYLAEKPK
jgi:hypothetical protein